MKKKRFCKVALEKVSRTDLICIGCGNFRTEWAIVPIGGAEPVAGLHTKCIPGMHVRHARKPKTEQAVAKDAAGSVTKVPEERRYTRGYDKDHDGYTG
jgi:hypothetical protein